MKTRLPAYLCLAAAMAIAGSSVVVGRILTLHLPVFLTSAASLFLALLVLAPLTWRTHRGLSGIPKGDLKVLFIQALAGIVLFRVFLLYGLRTTSATAGGIITSATPAVVGLIAFLFLKERPAWNKAGGIALSVAGVLAVNTAGLSAGAAGHGSVWGNLLVFGAVAGEALFCTLQKKISKGTPPLTRTALVSLFAFLSFLPFAVYEGLRFDFTSVRWSDGLCIAYYGVVVTVVAFILFYNGAAAVPASTAGVFAGFMPVSSVLLANMILGERLMPCHLLGLGFVVAGIALMAPSAEPDPRPADGGRQTVPATGHQ